MSWPPDVPDFPIKKPYEIEKLERLPRNILNAMTKVEIEEKIRDAADSLAKTYFHTKQETGSMDECALIVSGALEQTGSSINGKLGTLMIGTSKEASQRACKRYYPEHPFPNEIEF